MMARGKATHGECTFCGRKFTGTGMARHLAACPRRLEAVEKAGQRGGPPENLYHLYVRDGYDGTYWLHLEMRGKAAMDHLDRYLRAIWLECCDHLSRFYLGRRPWAGRNVPFRVSAAQVFSRYTEVGHVYDIGTETRTVIRAVSVREGRPLSKRPIFLMARNHAPQYKCSKCDQPAAYFCVECVHELFEQGVLCRKHAASHPHDDYGEPLPIVNSPRLGRCAYSGPAEPPY